MGILHRIWEEHARAVLAVLFIAVVGIGIFAFTTCSGKGAHVIGRVEDIQVPDVAYAADDAMSDISSDIAMAARYVKDSYMGELYGIDGEAWAKAYMPRVKFSVLASKMDIEDESKAYASVSVTHPDTVALTQKLMSEQSSIPDYSQVGQNALSALESVGDVETRENLTFVLEDGRWVPDEVSKGTMVRYLYGNVM